MNPFCIILSFIGGVAVCWITVCLLARFIFWLAGPTIRPDVRLRSRAVTPPKRSTSPTKKKAKASPKPKKKRKKAAKRKTKKKAKARASK